MKLIIACKIANFTLKSGGDSQHRFQNVVVTSHYRHIQSCAYVFLSQCNLPPDKSDIPAITPTEADARCSDPGVIQGRVNLVGWYTRPKVVTHPSTNRARLGLTSFM